ncbi:universal stress protein [Gordoniibacillus kamchatkensis]|uniref:universal stress protein n=1 Tax=Gordoniibacillus kamchatkensis TaxID=1590651 RepID=UPI000698C314
MMYQHILVAYDGSELAKTALTQAVCMVKEHPGTKLTVLHVIHFPNYIVGEAYFGALPSLEKEYAEFASLLNQDAEKAIEGLSGAEVEVRRGFRWKRYCHAPKRKGAT